MLGRGVPEKGPSEKRSHGVGQCNKRGGRTNQGRESKTEEREREGGARPGYASGGAWDVVSVGMDRSTMRDRRATV